ncbi:hypothetical protein GCM10023194_45790 [Planotetraspora phitsanulokensis]|uniref:Uncharacterized protein n=1 Tax=Planotetraspora phitsanulokensis TaxID=575192 RepID=A0A8J3U954_9ACTN|nr:hypothetical protein Pph01_60260 [Planotetraspora phitsanulokensis]
MFGITQKPVTGYFTGDGALDVPQGSALGVGLGLGLFVLLATAGPVVRTSAARDFPGSCRNTVTATATPRRTTKPMITERPRTLEHYRPSSKTDRIRRLNS